MRIPSTISGPAFKVYLASAQAESLPQEQPRTLKSEIANWDVKGKPPTLGECCVKGLASDFEEHANAVPLLTYGDRILLLETLTCVGLDIARTAPRIQDGVYWTRACRHRWADQSLDVSLYGDSWKRMYVERYLQDYIEHQEPGYTDYKEAAKLARVCSPFVRCLRVGQLRPPRVLEARPAEDDRDECSVQEFVPEHFDLQPVIAELAVLSEVHLTFGLNRAGIRYSAQHFRFHKNDIANFANGLAVSEHLSLLHIHRCSLDDTKLTMLLQKLIACQSIDTIDLSRCSVGDIGAKALAKFMTLRTSLRVLKLQDNQIGPVGVKGLAYALACTKCCALETLELKMNPVGDTGALALSCALHKRKRLLNLGLACTAINDAGCSSIANMLLFHNSLQSVDLSNNPLGPEGVHQLVSAVSMNRAIVDIDLRECPAVTPKQYAALKAYLYRNRDKVRKRKADHFFLSFQGEESDRSTGNKIMFEV